jgi:hypothetical protein
MHAHVKRKKGERKIEVEFNGLDCLAKVNGASVTPPELIEAMDLEDEADARQSARDLKWAQTHPRYSAEIAAAVTQHPRYSKERKQAASRIARMAARAAKGDEEYVQITKDVALLKRRAARVRADALHKWTTAIVADADTLDITDMKVSKNSQTPHGDEKEWGAETEIVSQLNRTVRQYAPSALRRLSGCIARRLASMGKRGIQVIMGLSTGLCRIYGKTWDTGDHLSTLPYICVRCHATCHLVASLTGPTNGQYTL